MFERYTEKARRVIFFARDEASQYGSMSVMVCSQQLCCKRRHRAWKTTVLMIR
jgi:hypothetical protein